MAKKNLPEYRKITLDYMKTYIEKNAPQDKAWFRSIVFDAKGKYQHLIAVKAFCERYMPEIIPVAKPQKPKVSDAIKDW